MCLRYTGGGELAVRCIYYALLNILLEQLIFLPNTHMPQLFYPSELMGYVFTEKGPKTKLHQHSHHVTSLWCHCEWISSSQLHGRGRLEWRFGESERHLVNACCTQWQIIRSFSPLASVHWFVNIRHFHRGLIYFFCVLSFALLTTALITFCVFNPALISVSTSLKVENIPTKSYFSLSWITSDLG